MPHFASFSTPIGPEEPVQRRPGPGSASQQVGPLKVSRFRLVFSETKIDQLDPPALRRFSPIRRLNLSEGGQCVRRLIHV